MTNETTINKLIEMRLSVLADAYRTQLSDHSMTRNHRNIRPDWLEPTAGLGGSRQRNIQPVII